MDKISLLNALSVKDIWGLVVKNPTTVKPDTSIPYLLEKIIEDTQTRHVYVIDSDNILVGEVRLTTVVGLLFPTQGVSTVLSDPHLFRNVDFWGKTVKEVMNTEPRSVYSDSSLQDLATCFLEEKVTELPVIDKDGKLKGQVNVYEIIKAYLKLRVEA